MVTWLLMRIALGHEARGASRITGRSGRADYSRAMFETSLERLADEVIETYVSWREACAGVERAYALWRSARRGERRLACAAHVAALDREQHAALAYARAIDRITPPRPLAPRPQRVAS